jgi:hypothetical protein
MKVEFKQGIVSHQPSFIQKNTSDGVDILANNAPVILTIAHKDNNYLFYEPVSVSNAWSSTFDGDFSWLFWDLNPATGERTFGQTSIKPIVSATTPISGHDEYGVPIVIEGRHWYNTANNVHLIRTASGWREVIRIFAGRITQNATSIESYFNNTTFTGTQIFNNTPTFSGRILFDDAGKPIVRNNKTFVTTENKIFASALRVDAFRLESNVIYAISEQNIAEFTLVAFIGVENKIRIAQYNDIGENNIGILMNNVLVGENASVVMQGIIENPLWDFSSVGNSQLWVNNGVLVDINPHIQNQSLYPKNKEPIAKAITKNSINFSPVISSSTLQIVDEETEIQLATINDAGISKLSLPAVDDSNPIVVGDNDPRLSDARLPLAHTHTASSITIIPDLNGNNNVLESLQSLHTEMATKVSKSGDTMTGLLLLSGNPTNNFHAATKQYVDGISVTLQNNIDDKVSKAGDAMTGLLTLSGNPTNNFHAATKQYVDSILNDKVSKSGDTMTGLLSLSGNPIDNHHATTKQYVDGIASALQDNINGKLSLTGGTLTGDLIISPTAKITSAYVPTNDSDVVNKLYVDSLTPATGDIALTDLTDVSDLIIPSANEILTYDDSDSKWKTNIDVNLKGKSVIRPNLISQTYKVNTMATIVNNVLTIDLAHGTYIPVLLTDNITSIVIITPDIFDNTFLYDITIIFTQNSSQLYTITYNVPTYYWSNEIPHSMTQTLNAIDIINMISYSPFRWYCFTKGIDMGVAGDSGPPGL